MLSARITQRGFTLIELVVVITLTGIIALIAARNISRPVAGFIDLGQRAVLVEAAELTLRRISREIRLALPNSLRITDGATQYLQSCTATTGGGQCAVEILRTQNGGRYRRLPDGSAGPCGSPGQDRIRFTASNDCFEIMGGMSGILPVAAPGADQDDCLTGTVDCIVIFNTGQAGANAWDADNIAGLQAASASAITFDISGAAGVTRFPFPSPRQRFQIVDTPVSFVCNPGAGTGEISRRAEYAITAAQSISPGPPGAVLGDRITACTFTYIQGSHSRNALLLVDLTFTSTDSQGNANIVRLMDEIQVPNVP
ncbi:MAG: prepilin-type N-terminal cleavage/methylation domain-containing protein [Gammaproteobacteria bacterium]|nr:MAG: prepilin-type N-terminal cleavage/methylation domain-containing protein [Gammaproteobacteria bacterium]